MKISSLIFFKEINIQHHSVLLKSQSFFRFIRPHSFCVRNLCCVNYLITIQIQSWIKLECCVHTCPNCSGFNLCGRINLRPAEHLIVLEIRTTRIYCRINAPEWQLVSSMLFFCDTIKINYENYECFSGQHWEIVNLPFIRVIVRERRLLCSFYTETLYVIFNQ